MRSLKPILRTLLLTSTLGLSLGACREDELLRGAAAALPATMALQGYPQGAYDPYADPYGRVPIGRPVSYDDAWAWGERSYALDRAFYETPPDYGFEYDGYEPWVWQTEDRWAMYADPYQDDYRYYYYEPGEVRPYFIRDDQYGYGYDDFGRLVVMYDLLGRIMPQSLLYQQDPYATDYYRRAYALRQASLQAQPIVVTREVWVVQQPIIVADQSRWIQAATTQQPWVEYRTKTKDRFARAFDDERRRREPDLTVARQDRGFLGLPIGRDRAERTQAPERVARLDNGVRGYPEPLTSGNGAAPSLAPKGRARAELRGQPGLDQAAAQRVAEQRRTEQQAEDRRRDLIRQQAEGRQRQDQQARAAAERQARLEDQDRQRQVQRAQTERNAQQVREQARQEQRVEQRSREQARQQQQAQQQAREQARQQQQAEQQARQQQQAQQQAREQARQQQQAEQQAREQARQQQQAQQQAREQARQQQQAREQARQQQQAQQQAREQARQQQQAQQQAREQARQQQQAQQQARAQEQQAAQPRGRNAAAADNAAAQATPEEHGKGRGHK
jgi:hypothetical protein